MSEGSSAGGDSRPQDPPPGQALPDPDVHAWYQRGMDLLRWGLVRFDPDRSVKIMIEESVSRQAWLVVLPPGDAGRSCDCDVVTMIAGEITAGTPENTVLRPGPVRLRPD